MSLGIKSFSQSAMNTIQSAMKDVGNYIKNNKTEIVTSVAIGALTGGTGFALAAGRIVVGSAVKSAAKSAATATIQQLSHVARPIAHKAGELAAKNVYKAAFTNAAIASTDAGIVGGITYYAGTQMAKYSSSSTGIITNSYNTGVSSYTSTTPSYSSYNTGVSSYSSTTPSYSSYSTGISSYSSKIPSYSSSSTGLSSYSSSKSYYR